MNEAYGQPPGPRTVGGRARPDGEVDAAADADRFFPADEYTARLAAVRADMAAQGLDALLLVSPEDIYYLIGLSHQGYFAYTLLLVPSGGPTFLVTRSMELLTIAAQAPDVEHVGFADDREPADATVQLLRDQGLTAARLGVDKASMYLPVRVWDQLRTELEVTWVDASDLVRDRRLVKSPRELRCVRESAAISDRALRAGITTAGVGVNEREVAASVYQSLVAGGSEYPGFAPLVRSAELLFQEHTTWRDRVLNAGECLFLELSASVRRYHAPLSRFVYLGRAPAGIDESAAIVTDGLEAVRASLVPGAHTGDVYAAWQDVVDRGLGHTRYRRHHCGYTVGIGFPPSWVGGPKVTSLRAGGSLRLREGMVFHVLSWLLGQELPDYGVSDTMLVTPSGGEILTSTSRTPIVVA
jgi:Xaa-Pro dipeptidase